jgi:hypothetical protein
MSAVPRGGIMPHRTLHIARQCWLSTSESDSLKIAKNALGSWRTFVTMCHRNAGASQHLESEFYLMQA